jgi:4-hydroxy-4-methyl-2-oxoglutarate aldolase
MTDEELIDGFGLVDASTVFDCNDRSGAIGVPIRALQPGMRLCGPAATVKCPAGDLKAVRRGVDAAPAGCVLAIECGGDEDAAIWGGTGTLVAQQRGLRGVLTNGRTRDYSQICAAAFPVFCTGTSVRGALRALPGWTDVAIAIAGVVIRPGDFIVGDDDGVVVVPRERTVEVLARALRKAEDTSAREQRIREGEPYDV